MSKAPNTDIALVFGGGGGKSAAPARGPMPMKPGMSGDSERAEPMADDEAAEGEDAPPPEFSTHAAEAFDPERSLEERTAALYRAIKSCGSY